MDADLFGEFLQGHLVVIAPGNVAGPDGSLLAKSLSYQQLLDDQCVEPWLLRRRPAFRIEIVGDLSSGRPLGTERCDPIQYFVVMLQLFKASYGSDNRMRRYDLSCPVAFYLGTLGLRIPVKPATYSEFIPATIPARSRSSQAELWVSVMNGS
jgi:hypothetical protein